MTDLRRRLDRLETQRPPVASEIDDARVQEMEELRRWIKDGRPPEQEPRWHAALCDRVEFMVRLRGRLMEEFGLTFVPHGNPQGLQEAAPDVAAAFEKECRRETEERFGPSPPAAPEDSQNTHRGMRELMARARELSKLYVKTT